MAHISARGRTQREEAARLDAAIERNLQEFHLKNIYAEGELQEAATTKEFLMVQTEGERQVQRRLSARFARFRRTDGPRAGRSAIVGMERRVR